MSAATTALARPRAGLLDVCSSLTGFVTTTWTVEPERLRRLLPHGIEPDLFELSNGNSTAFVSAVSFVNTRFHPGFAPFMRLTAPQTNYRAYVRRGAERAAWFVLTQFDSFTVVVPRYGFGMPWRRMHATHDARWDGDRLSALTWHADSEQGEERLRLRGTGRPIGVPDGFADEAEARLVLTHPTVGYFRRPSGVTARYGVWHATLELEHCEVDEARYEPFERLGLIEPRQAPASVLAQRVTDYVIFLPPRRVRADSASEGGAR